MGLAETAGNYLLKIFNTVILKDVTKSWDEFKAKKDDIPFLKLISDTLFVARSVWFFLLFDLLIFVFFILLSQGHDILLVVLENTGRNYWSTVIFLALGILAWSIVAEFGTRYKMYVSDNTGNSLSDERVEWRKFLQKFFSRISLYFPTLIIVAGFIVVALQNFTLTELASRYDILGTLALFYGVLALIYKLYAPVVQTPPGKPISQKISPAEQKRPGWLTLSIQESSWASKLFGIYNHYVFLYPMGEVREDLDIDTGQRIFPYIDESLPRDAFDITITGFELETPGQPAGYSIQGTGLDQNWTRPYQTDILDWPQKTLGDDGLPLVNPKFILYRVAKKQGDIWARWFYRIPFSFYPKLHCQVLIFFLSCTAALLFFSVAGNGLYLSMGAAGLIAFAFAGWCGIYIGLIFLEKAPLKFRANWRLILFCWLLICSEINNDHPVRTSSQDIRVSGERPSLVAHFNRWYDSLLKSGGPVYKYPDSSGIGNCCFPQQNDSPGNFAVPVVFVCAEGGACRTGAYTALMLSKLAQQFPGFNQSIYAYSSVSGGSLGVGLYNAITNLADNHAQIKPQTDTAICRSFFQKDYLAAAIGKLCFCEVLQFFLPGHSNSLDRAIALEESWESGYRETAMAYSPNNVFKQDYFSAYSPGKIYPAWFINTTSSETGKQCWITNVTPDPLMPSHQERDLWRSIKGTTAYSTAINFSTRFPLVSPSATIDSGDERRHYVDGGYAENTGAETMYQLMQALYLEDSVFARHVKPIVLMLEYDSAASMAQTGNRFGNEWNDIISALVHTRGGRTNVAKTSLKYLSENVMHGKLIELALDQSDKNVPLDWILSDKAVEYISADCDQKIKDNKGLQCLKMILKKDQAKKPCP